MTAFGPVSTEKQGNVGRILIDNPPVNALSQAVRAGIADALAELSADRAVKAIVLEAQGRTFPAGADIKEFGKPPTEPFLPDLCHLIEGCGKPVVAALHGTVLGGGFEIALSAHFRVAEARCKFGFPEVKLGLLPGAGGTQRAPRLIGAGPALDMILSGDPIPAARAMSMGLVDKVVDSDLSSAALVMAQDLIAQKTPPRRTSECEEGFADPNAYWAAMRKHRDKVAKSARGQIAQKKILECVEAAQMLPFERGMELERTLYLDCHASPQAAALRYAFFAERQAAKPPKSAQTPREVSRIGVIGAGTMGTGIVLSLISAGYEVTLVERSSAALKAGIARIEASLERAVDRGRIAARLRDAQLGLISKGTDLKQVADCDLVVEAIIEDFDVKSELFANLSAICKPGAILASNTSYLDINGLAQKTNRPQDVLGLHFFSPADRMKLVEVIPGDETQEDAVQTGFHIAKKLGKVPVLAGVCDGFIGNSILTAYRQAADFLLEDGANPGEIDAAMRDYGFALGPYQVADLAGLDISWARRKRLADSRDPAERYVDIGDRLCEQGWFGQKAGRGYYRYPDGSRVGVEDPEVAALIDAAREEKGVQPRTFTSEEIQRRCLLAMVNAGARLVGEKIAQRPSDVDAVMLHGYGFPRWKGGPMFQADLIGMKTLAEELDALASEDPGFWSPSALILRLAEGDEGFAALSGV